MMQLNQEGATRELGRRVSVLRTTWDRLTVALEFLSEPRIEIDLFRSITWSEYARRKGGYKHYEGPQTYCTRRMIPRYHAVSEADRIPTILKGSVSNEY